MIIRWVHIILGGICFVLTLLFFMYTSSSSIDFNDAAEFALVASIGSVAHAPGTPSYVLLGWIWIKIFTLLTSDKIFLITLFSCVCVSAATVFNYFTFFSILKIHAGKNKDEIKLAIIAFVSTLALSCGVTFWNWANSIEVYALQILCGAMMLYGFSKYQIEKKYIHLVTASIGYSIGLANHHLYMIIFTPLILFFFADNLFHNSPKSKTSIKSGSGKSNLFSFLHKVLTGKHFLLMTALSTIITLGFYLWMMFRAKIDFPFEFGNPDNLTRLWDHITGKVYTYLLVGEQAVKGFFFLKLTYFLKLIFWQYLIFLPFLLTGIYYLAKQKLYKLLFLIGGYFLFNLWLHLKAPTATGDEEGHMVMPFLILGLAVLYGIYWATLKTKYYYLLILLVVVQIFFVYPKVDKRDYNISESLMHELDRSAPPNSIIVMSDWTMVMQYYHYRIVDNFRPDLVVLNYDIKFTNHRIVPTLYPGFYKKIEKEYLAFVDELGKEHPDEINNTGCTLNTTVLIESFKSLFSRLREISARENIPLMFDPRAFFSLGGKNILGLNSAVYPSGCFISNMKTEVGNEFLNVDYSWLNSPLVLNDPAATDKISDIQAMLDFHRDYYKQSGNDEKYQMAIQTNNKIKKLHKEMMKNMPELFQK